MPNLKKGEIQSKRLGTEIFVYRARDFAVELPLLHGRFTAKAAEPLSFFKFYCLASFLDSNKQFTFIF